MEVKYVLYFEEVLQTIRWQIIDRYAVGMEKQKWQIFNFLIIEEQILVEVLLWEINAEEICFCSLRFLTWVDAISSLVVNMIYLLFLILILCTCLSNSALQEFLITPCFKLREGYVNVLWFILLQVRKYVWTLTFSQNGEYRLLIHVF